MHTVATFDTSANLLRLWYDAHTSDTIPSLLHFSGKQASLLQYLKQRSVVASECVNMFTKRSQGIEKGGAILSSGHTPAGQNWHNFRFPDTLRFDALYSQLKCRCFKTPQPPVTACYSELAEATVANPQRQRNNPYLVTRLQNGLLPQKSNAYKLLFCF